MLKFLLTHTPQARRNYYGERALASLRELGEVRLHEGKEALGPAELIGLAGDVNVIVSDRLTAGPAEVFTALPRLQAFLRCAVDIKNIDVEAASAAGVLVTRISPGFVESVSEMAIGFLVDLSRGIGRTTADYHAGRMPEIRQGRQLAGSTVGIIGYGRIARYLAPITVALGMKVLIADPYATVEDERLTQVPLNHLLAEADYVVCLALATEETENLMGADAFARMKPTAYFLNLSRGDLVDEAALSAALTSGRIAGAALDVGRAADQMPTPAIARLPNVIATPHIAALTPSTVDAQALYTVGQVSALAHGEVPPNAANADRWTRRP